MNKFTLLEVLLVTLILGLMASTALLIIEDTDDQQRYEDNADRLARIRYALIGNPQLQINQQPVISGYIYDTGQVATMVNDLIEKTPAIRNYATDNVLGFSWGWRGPYISSVSNDYKDGWGWDWDNGISIIEDSLTVTSLGKDGSLGGSEFDTDVSLKVHRNRYEVDSLRFRVSLGGSEVFDLAKEYALLILHPSDNTLPEFISTAQSSEINISTNATSTTYLNFDIQADMDQFLTDDSSSIPGFLVGNTTATMDFMYTQTIRSAKVRVILLEKTSTSNPYIIISEEPENAEVNYHLVNILAIDQSISANITLEIKN